MEKAVDAREITVRMMGSEIREKRIRLNRTGDGPVQASVLAARLLPLFGAGSPLAERDEAGADESVSWHLAAVVRDGTETVFGAHDTVDFNQDYEAFHLIPRTVAGA